MKAISLWQPYASLIAHGLKRVETRHWPTSYRGLLLIHAAKRWTAEERDKLEELAAEFPSVHRLPPIDKLPLGALVAVAKLTGCHQMDEAAIAGQTPLERAVGGWAPGRFAWALEGVVPLVRPIPLRGRQGLFEVAVHDVGREAWSLIEVAVSRG